MASFLNEGFHKRTLKRRATTAVDADLKLKILRKDIESDDYAVEVEELPQVSTSPEHLDSVHHDELLSAGLLCNIIDSGSSSQATTSEAVVHTDQQHDGSTANNTVLESVQASKANEYEWWWNNFDTYSDADSLNSDITDDIPLLHQSVYLPLLSTSFYFSRNVVTSIYKTPPTVASFSVYPSNHWWRGDIFH